MKVPIKTYKDEKFVRLKFNPRYAVSNRGRIYDSKTKDLANTQVFSGVNVFNFIPTTPVYGKNGKRRAIDSRGRITITVQRLVAEHFCKTPSGLWIVAHKNYNKLDDRVENLVVVSTGRHPIGENRRYQIPRLVGRKLNAEAVLAIKKELLAKVSLKSVAKRYKISEMSVSRIKNGDAWSHVGPVISKKKKVVLLSEGMVRKVRRLLKDHTHKEVSDLTGVKMSSIARISTGIYYRWVK